MTKKPEPMKGRKKKGKVEVIMKAYSQKSAPVVKPKKTVVKKKTK